MKKIINGKKYNTETATCVGRFSYRGGFDYVEEFLYKKKTGEFFIYGEGGADSKYAQSISYNEWCGGEKIIPITIERAKRWAEEHMDADEYESVFGPVEE